MLILFSRQNYLDKFRKRKMLKIIILGCIPNKKQERKSNFKKGTMEI